MDTAGGSSLPSASCSDGRKRRVCYYYDSGIANVDYGPNHWMVPRRVDMAHALVRSYGLLGDMRRLRTRHATEAEICAVHDREYVELLRDLTPEAYNSDKSVRGRAERFDIGTVVSNCNIDNPVIAGLWDYCQRYAGGSLSAARALAGGESDVAINWSGGMHHACDDKASGFCYVNDITLAISELLRHFRRVLYLDIDVHHGDGVEAAFAESNRVMTVSFHQRTPGFFPLNTGLVDHVGSGEGLYRTLNVPMKQGMDDDGYQRMFRPIMTKVMAVFQPEAVVMQCGADSLSGDRLGRLNLSIAGHAQCVGFMRGFNVPLLLLGGGGYTVNHVAACWCYETAVAVGKEIGDDIPSHWYDRHYEGQDYKLHYPVQTCCKNDNDDRDITITTNRVLEHLSKLEAAPNVQFADPEGGSIDAEELFDDSPPRQESDPLERLQRQCEERDMTSFFVSLGKRQRSLDRGTETVLHRVQAVKKNGIR
jgi:histone deacetylase 1/2